MITLQNISFRYPKGGHVFTRLSLDLRAGHIYGLLGKNGEGKTTLLKIIAGLRFPQMGSATIFGNTAEQRDAKTLQQFFFLQEEPFTPHLSINQYVKVYAPFYPNFNQEQFYRHLEDFDLYSRALFLDKISYGQKKKVLIAFALAANTPVLLMDEPTNGLDIPSKTIFRRLMANAVDSDRLVVISTHQVRDLHSLIDSIIILDNGEIVINETAEKITEKLLFEPMNSNETADHILYSEDNIRGNFVVKENPQHLDNQLDIEMFFNAVLTNKQKIKSIFNN